MKIDLADYKNAFEQLLKKRKADPVIYSEMVAITEDFLPCSTCKELLPNEEFSKAKNFTNRNGRYPVCKECCKAARRG